MPHSPLGVVGSRAGSPAACAVAGSCAARALRAGAPLLVGCATGVDRAAVVALSAGASSGPAVVRTAALASHILAAFGPTGSGRAACSAVRAVRTAAALGVPVAWWAGGPPALPLSGRLVGRSLALVRQLAGEGGQLLAFPSLPAVAPRWSPSTTRLWVSSGSGSWSTAFAAARMGVPVWLWSPDEQPAPFPAPGTWAPGAPSPSFALGFWLWRPAPPTAGASARVRMLPGF